MDAELPVAYTAVTKGTPVLSSSGTRFGTVEHVLQVPELDLFDGLVVATRAGLRFVDRDQTTRLTAQAVHTALTDAEAAALPAPDGEPVYSVDVFQDEGDTLTDRLARLFRREHWNLDK